MFTSNYITVTGISLVMDFTSCLLFILLIIYYYIQSSNLVVYMYKLKYYVKLVDHDCNNFTLAFAENYLVIIT